LAAAEALATTGRGDHILLKRGDTWVENFPTWTKSGVSPGDPMILGAYGSLATARPIISSPSVSDGSPSDWRTCLQLGGNVAGVPQAIDHLWIKDLELTPSSWVGTGQRIGILHITRHDGVLIEGCYIHEFSDNIVYTPLNGRSINCKIRRNVIADCYRIPGTNAAHGVGVYAWKTDNLLVEENIFDHNGWKEGTTGAEANIFSHNFYMAEADGSGLQSFGFQFINNMSSNGSSHGMQARSGGVIYGNVFAKNAVGLLIGRGSNTIYVQSTAQYNVVIDGRDLTETSALGWGIYTQHVDHAVLDKNIVVNCGTAGAQQAYEILDDVLITLTGNIAKNWTGGIQREGTNTYLVESNNDWLGTAGTYPFPNRTIGDYAGTINLTATHAGMLTAMRALRRGSWTVNRTPAAVRNYLLAGYGIFP
jgi:hypothetical protein